MAYDPRKKAGEMCARSGCDVTEKLHAIVRRCVNGHTETLRYCDAHITRMMMLAFSAGSSYEGTHVGIAICECGLPLILVAEAKR